MRALRRRPRDSVEARLMDMWRNVLDCGPFRPDENFFLLGGTSLQALYVVASIQSAFGIELSLMDFYASSTVENLALLIRAGRSEMRAESPVHPVDETGSEQPLFCVHAESGEVFFLYELAGRGLPFPVYGLRAVGLEGVEEPLRTVEAMGARYVEELRRTQPNGPYRLGGYCVGGLVAYEMCRLLQAADERVESLILFDASPEVEPDEVEDFDEITTRAVRQLATDYDGEPTGQGWESELRMLKRHGAVPRDLSADALRRRLEVLACITHAQQTFRPAGPLSVPTVHILAEDYDSYMTRSDRHRVWRGLLGDDVTEVVIPDGTHARLFLHPGLSNLLRDAVAGGFSGRRRIELDS